VLVMALIIEPKTGCWKRHGLVSAVMSKLVTAVYEKTSFGVELKSRRFLSSSLTVSISLRGHLHVPMARDPLYSDDYAIKQTRNLLDEDIDRSLRVDQCGNSS